jgi:hypothetical protein
MFDPQTVEEHMQLSFSHIMKHWKRNPNQPGVTKVPGSSRNVLLRFYPPQSALGKSWSQFLCVHITFVFCRWFVVLMNLLRCSIFFVPICRGQLKKKEGLWAAGEWRKPTEMPGQAVRVLPFKMVSIVKVWGPTVHILKLVSTTGPTRCTVCCQFIMINR